MKLLAGKTTLLFTFLYLMASCSLIAQTEDCIFKDTLFAINFGTNQYASQYNLSSLKNYKQAFSNCPDDGNYAFTSGTSNCFFGDWISLNEDHTASDINGRMMLVNASYRSGDFF